MTRNIVIKTADLSSSGSDQYIGAHMMVMRGGRAYIDGVEFDRMGQAGVMARYPFHWHLAGEAYGQYIKNSSIHHSFQRCITVHGTHGTTVHNNFCYEHRGHGVFLEDGNERNNRITTNLVMKSLRPYAGKALLESDSVSSHGTGRKHRRFAPTSSFWISHPKNHIVNNVSAGSQGTGFWMSFEEKNLCDKITNTQCTMPAKSNTTKFDNNLAKANLVGFTWDGARGSKDANNPNNPDDRLLQNSRYSPPIIPTLTGNQSLKSHQACFYTRSTTMNFDRTITSDCGWHHFHAFNIRVRNSIMIGDGPMPRYYATKRDIANNSQDRGQYGIVMYDGPFELSNVHFQNFSTTDAHHPASNGVSRRIASIPIGKIGGANKYTNRTRGLSFSPEPYRRVDLNKRGEGWQDAHVSQSLIDIDGTLTGRANGFMTTKTISIEPVSVQIKMAGMP